MSGPEWTRGELPQPPLHHVLMRLSKWGVGLALFMAQLAWFRVRGGREQAWLGVKLRQLFERVGGTAIKIGQQLSVRYDVLSAPICDALAQLTDAIAPIPDAELDGLLEAGLGRPPASVFSRIDRNAIGSASVACVYRAWLTDGTAVAVKLRRPDVVRHFAADLAVVQLFVTIAEAFTLVRGGMFANLHHDLIVMLGEETDFLLEARYQRAFAKIMKEVGMKWLTSPKVISAISTRSVLVSEFIDGIPFSRVLQATEQGDQAELQRLAALGIEPSKLARRLVRFSSWARFEAPFFHADPHPGNVFVRPNSEMVMLDFGSCGVTSAKTRRYQIEIIRQFLRLDVGAISQVALAELSPLPWVDVDEFRREIHHAFSTVMMAALDPKSQWSERILSGVWIKMLSVTRRYQIRMHLDTVRSIRSFLLYDTLAYRLDPTLGIAIRRQYMRELERRAADEAREKLGEALDPHTFSHRAEALIGRAEHVASGLMLAVDAARTSLEKATRTGLHFARWGLRALGVAAAAGAGLALISVLEVRLPPVGATALTVGAGVVWLGALWLLRMGNDQRAA